MEKKSNGYFGLPFVLSLIFSAIVFGIIMYFNVSPLHYRWGFKINILLIILFSSYIVFMSLFRRFNAKQFAIVGIGSVSLLILMNVVFFFMTTTVIHSKDYHHLIGEVEERKFESDVAHVDLEQLPTIDKELAGNYADKKLGEIPALGSQVEVGELTLQQIDGKLYYVGPLEHSGILKWFQNREGTQGYVKVSATDAQDVELVTQLNGKDIKLKYLSSAYFNSNVERHAYLSHPTQGIKDYSFELNDEGNPYWVASTYDHTIGLSGEVITGTLIIDAQTGEMQQYTVEDTPKWVDIIQPQSTVEKHLDYWGEYVHGFFNFSNQDKLKTTEGMQVIYNNGECFFYTGISSVGKDESTVGFALTNTRTGETTKYNVSGATETAGMQSAEGSVQNLQYKATHPILINVQNEPTYFLTLKDKKGLVKSYGMVNVENYNLVATGDTLQATLNSYVKALAGKGVQGNLETNGVEKSETGTVERIGSVTTEGNQLFYIVVKEKPNSLIIVPSAVSKEVALTKENDVIDYKYIELPNMDGITVKEFDNKNIDLK
ncbi:cell shape-determining protein [Priestia taiwanensis]|uniref:Cell shape-determining protein n=1 Tax=Priestia taiwanensis TaxID=1347902 RepID=A0A917ANN3_9BACI|nr:cell shape-determining protein [Priestia taiwanensis]MBM7362655.1 hypothetical protein [Priestia taiwanensis]GGE63992.1 hypothetical protein GCM10007140_12810 [Priestia taiwanensis]